LLSGIRGRAGDTARGLRSPIGPTATGAERDRPRRLRGAPGVGRRHLRDEATLRSSCLPRARFGPPTGGAHHHRVSRRWVREDETGHSVHDGSRAIDVCGARLYSHSSLSSESHPWSGVSRARPFPAGLDFETPVRDLWRSPNSIRHHDPRLTDVSEVAAGYPGSLAV